MLKTIDAILTMLREQEAALITAQVERAERDQAMVKVIMEEGEAQGAQLQAMIGNVRLAIRKLEGSEVEDAKENHR